MVQFAYLAPVGPFAGFSNAARQKIGERFPRLSIAEIESAAACFLKELQGTPTDPRLAEVRDELNIFAKELARFHCALNHIRVRGLDQAIGEAGRMICGENGIEDLDRSLDNLRTAIQQTSRVLPSGRPQLASRRLIALLAEYLNQAGFPPGGADGDPLLSLVDLIFDDLMVGADASSAVGEWHQSQTAEIDHQRASILLDLVS